MASRDREWFYHVDLEEVNKEIMSSPGVATDKLIKEQQDPEENKLRLSDGERGDAYLKYRRRMSEGATKMLYNTAVTSGGFVEARVLAYYVGFGAANLEIGQDTGTGFVPVMSMLHFLSFYPDIPASTLRLFLGIARNAVNDEAPMNQINSNYTHKYVMNGETALHAAVRSLDMVPMYSADEYIVDNAVEKIRVLLQFGANPLAANNYGVTPHDLVQMLEKQWDMGRKKEERWPDHGYEKTDPYNVMESSGLLVRPRHVTTPIIAAEAFKLIKDVMKDPSTKLYKNVIPNAFASAIMKFDWASVRTLIRDETAKQIPDSTWLTSTRNVFGLPTVWLFLAAVYYIAEKYPGTKVYVPVYEFSKILEFYYKSPPNSETRNEELEQVYWYCVGASNYFANPVYDDDGIPQSPIDDDVGRENFAESSTPSTPNLPLSAGEESLLSGTKSEEFALPGSESFTDVDERLSFPGAVGMLANRDWVKYGWDITPGEFYGSMSVDEVMQKFIYMITLLGMSAKYGKFSKNANEHKNVYDSVLGKFTDTQRAELFKTVFSVKTEGSVNQYFGLTKSQFTQYLKSMRNVTNAERVAESQKVFEIAKEAYKHALELFSVIDTRLEFFSTGTGTETGTETQFQSQLASNTKSVPITLDFVKTYGNDNVDDVEEEKEEALAASSTGGEPLAVAEDDDETEVTAPDDANPNSNVTATFTPNNDFMRLFFRYIVHESIFDKEASTEKAGVLRRQPSPVEAVSVGSAIHRAMRVGDAYSLKAIASSRAGKALGSLDLKDSATGKMPLQTAIAAGHSKATVSRLYTSLFPTKK